MDPIWTGIDRLLAAASDDRGIAAHGLHLLELRRRGRIGAPTPSWWAENQRHMASVALAVPGALARVRAVTDAPILLIKGPEIAAYFPDPLLRPFADLDLLIPDAERVHAALLSSGFVTIPQPPARGPSHHQLPIGLPGGPMALEVHDRPRWLPWLAAPATNELIAARVPSLSGHPGISTLSPVHHALVTAIHSWSHGPFYRVLQLLDVALLREGCDADALSRTADRWGIRRIWDTTSRAADALLLGDHPDLSLRVLGRHATHLDEQSILGLHLRRYAGALWAPTPGVAARAMSSLVASSVRPSPGHSWRTEVPRLARIVRSAGRPISDYRDIER